ncbi:MAG: type IV pilus modification PilV family protein [Candidatus Rokuibacteriota bacterium]
MTKRTAAAGFTLLEVLVALAILGVAIVVCIQGFAQGLRLLKLSGDHQRAVLVADQKVREVVTPTEGQEQGTEGPFTWERTTRLVAAPELAPLGRIAAWRVWEVAVTVRWDEHRQLDIATLRTMPIEAATQIPGERQ